MRPPSASGLGRGGGDTLYYGISCPYSKPLHGCGKTYPCPLLSDCGGGGGALTTVLKAGENFTWGGGL